MPLHIVRDDIANMRADAVVVPANSLLLIGGGAGESVARMAGIERMQQACNEIGGCPVGSAVVTPAFDFPAKMVVHAVGPMWMGGQSGEADVLYSCVSASLAAAISNGAQSIAMPLLATGTLGYPVGPAIDIETRAIRDFLQDNEADVWLVLYDRESMRAGRSVFDSVAEYIDDVYVGKHGFEGTALLGGSAMSLGEMDVRMAPNMRPASFQAPAAAVPPPPAASSPRRKRKSLFKGGKKRREQQKAKNWKAGAAETSPRELKCGVPMADAAALGAETQAIFEKVVPLAVSPSLAERLDQLDESFAQTVLRLIDERGMTDPEVYKRANMSRQLFAKIRKDDHYRPTKKTACALAFALGLDYDDALALLGRAGFTLSHSSKFDVIIEYFLVNNVHDVFQVNEALFAYDQPILG